MTFCGPARDTVLTNQQTEKLNFDTNYMTIQHNNLSCRSQRVETKLSACVGGKVREPGGTALIGSEIFGNELGTRRLTVETQRRRTETHFT